MSFEAEFSKRTFRGLVLRKVEPGKPTRVIAYLCLRLVEDDIYITNLAVDAAYRRCGVATFLLGHSIQLARAYGARRAVLEVRASNLAAIRLYTKMGFWEAGQRRQHYLDTGEDAVVMIKEMAGRGS